MPNSRTTSPIHIPRRHGAGLAVLSTGVVVDSAVVLVATGLPA